MQIASPMRKHHRSCQHLKGAVLLLSMVAGCYATPEAELLANCTLLSSLLDPTTSVFPGQGKGPQSQAAAQANYTPLTPSVHVHCPLRRCRVTGTGGTPLAGDTDLTYFSTGMQHPVWGATQLSDCATVVLPIRDYLVSTQGTAACLPSPSRRALKSESSEVRPGCWA